MALGRRLFVTLVSRLSVFLYNHIEGVEALLIHPSVQFSGTCRNLLPEPMKLSADM